MLPPTSHDDDAASNEPVFLRRGSSFPKIVFPANAREAWRSISLETGTKLVWREHGAPPVLLESMQECLEHSLIGGLRAAAIAYGIRTSIAVALLIARVLRYPARFRSALIRRVLFSKDARKFGAMIGTFTALYKLILNTLPILQLHWKRISGRRTNRSPASTDLELADTPDGLHLPMRLLKKGRRSAPSLLDQPLAASLVPLRAGSPPSSELACTPPPTQHSSASFTPPSTSNEKDYIFQPWQAAVAGSVAAGVAIVFERPANRSGVGQQLFVRGLQGFYNAWSQRTGIVVPCGSVWVFSLCSAQILYAYLLRPHTLSPQYDAWIQSMSITPLESVKIARSLVHTGSYDPKLLETILDGRSRPWNGSSSIILPENRVGMLAELARIKDNVFEPPVLPCPAFHPHHTSCVANGLLRIYESAKLLLPIYGALHLIPAVLFRRKALLDQPLRSALRIILGTIRSSTFIGVYVSIIISGHCALRNVSLLKLPEPFAGLVRSVQRSQLAWWMYCLLCGLSLFVENPHRREELAMYVLPKAGESAWVTFREVVLGIKTRRSGAWKADVALSSVGMGMVMSLYQTNPEALSGFVRKVLYQFIGPN